MDAAVLIPWRAGCPHRTAALDWVRARWEALGFPVHLGIIDGEWRKADAIRSALDHTDADVLIVADADVWCDGHLFINEIAAQGGWAVPHEKVHRLDEPSTQAVLDGGTLEGTYDQRPYRGHLGGGLVVIHRDTWHAAPMDRRFVGWGQEDDAWGLALTKLAGPPLRGTAPLWHLWHPHPERRTRHWGSIENMRLYKRYLRTHTPDEMRALVAEASEEVAA